MLASSMPRKSSMMSLAPATKKMPAMDRSMSPKNSPASWPKWWAGPPVASAVAGPGQQDQHDADRRGEEFDVAREFIDVDGVPAEVERGALPANTASCEMPAKSERGDGQDRRGAADGGLHGNAHQHKHAGDRAEHDLGQHGSKEFAHGSVTSPSRESGIGEGFG